MTHRLALPVLLALLVGGCVDRPEGDLEVHWSINGDRSPAGCQAAGVSSVRVLVDHTGTAPEDWPAVDLPCADGQGTLRLAEGIYRVRLVALDAGGEARSQPADLSGVAVVEGGTTRLPENPDVEPPVDLAVAICGDGVAQSGEWCDATDLGGYDCAKRGYDGGSLACAPDCTLDVSGCTTCGDGLIAGDEACDASDLGGLDCVALGWDGGSLACAPDCTLDASGCTGCGNGRLDPGETCDDGNTVSGDGCSAACQVEHGALRLAWTVREADGVTAATCAAAGIVEVVVEVTVAGLGDVSWVGTSACTDLGDEVADLAFGLYTVRLSGRDGSQVEVAGGSALVDHSLPDGTDVAVDLVMAP